MKQLDLNIDLPKNKNPKIANWEVAVAWIIKTVAIALNKTTPDGRPTAASSAEIHRKYSNIMAVLEKADRGLVFLKDDDYGFLESKFKQGVDLMPVNRDVSDILIKTSAQLDKAKNVQGEEKKCLSLIQ